MKAFPSLFRRGYGLESIRRHNDAFVRQHLPSVRRLFSVLKILIGAFIAFWLYSAFSIVYSSCDYMVTEQRPLSFGGHASWFVSATFIVVCIFMGLAGVVGGCLAIWGLRRSLTKLGVFVQE